MARLANMVYLEKPIKAYKDAAKSNAKDGYKKHLVDEGGKETEMWYYECKKEGTEAILTFSKEKNRCTVIFRGTETEGRWQDVWKDVSTDLFLFKKPLGPEGAEDDHPKDCCVHGGFRNQYYGTVTEFRNDGDVKTELRADEGSIEGMMLETALLQKVRRCM